MIRTPVCELLGITHPVFLGGMASASAAKLTAAVSEAGGLGAVGATPMSAQEVKSTCAAIREATEKPFALNYLIFRLQEEGLAARREQPLKEYFDRAHDAGSKVMFMAGRVDEARRAADAGADVIVAQGSEGGGHVGWMASLALLPMVVDAVAPLPVLAAGGIADGRGLAAALCLGAQGVLMGTRFLATEESPLPQAFKDVIVRSDGHDTVLTEIPDIASGQVWPGAMARAWRNRFIERWAGREWDLRQNRAEAFAAVQEARGHGDPQEASILIGQDAGLIRAVVPAAEVVRRVVEEAEEILSERLPGLVHTPHAGERPAPAEGPGPGERPVTPE
ncbi:MAG: nitronate monooxygenase [Candidatus Tectomicrobia bacterium]|nr:nitronate monooxygenase [Candidatus Tectomicrobia bacterium]